VHLTSNPTAWYVIRASGVVAYVLLSSGAVLGITLAGKARLPRWPRFAVEDVHRFIGLLVGAFVTLHVLTIAIDAYLPFSVSGLGVPFVSAYRPVWTALGIVAAELLIALAITNKLRRKLPYKVWRRAHYLNFPVWLLATLHGLGSGTDRHTLWLLSIELLSVGAVLGALAIRVSPHFPDLAPRWIGAGAMAAGLVVVVVAQALPTGGNGHTRAAVRIPAGGFTESFTGRIQRQDGVRRVLVSLSGEGKGQRHVLVRFDLLGDNGQLAQSEIQLRYAQGGATCVGSVSSLQNTSIAGSCTFADGTTRTIEASWQATPGSAVQGRLAVSA
jgi:sulfoxide reductase heme-binding subunit YedZ